MARNYILNLGEETRKGMLEKARSGVYPSFAPVGYRNADGPSGKREIVSDPDTAPVIAAVPTIRDWPVFAKGARQGIQR